MTCAGWYEVDVKPNLTIVPYTFYTGTLKVERGGTHCIAWFKLQMTPTDQSNSQCNINLRENYPYG